MNQKRRKRQDKNKQESLLNLSSQLELPLVPETEYIPAEVSLETIGYFTPSSKRVKGITTKEKKVAEKINPDGTKEILTIKIIATGEYGLPITSDLDYYRAFLKIIDEIVEREGQIPDRISIPTKRLIRYTGKQVNAREIQEVKDWIRRNRYTGIQGFIYKAEKGDYDEIGDEPLFSKYRLRGQQMENGEITETNMIWLAPWFRSNYIHHYLRPIDFAFHKRLRKPIAKSLYPILETGWYASSGGYYQKSYHELCGEFLLKEYRYLSDIKKQLDPSHRELEREYFLAKWEYRKSTPNSDFIITYHPGEKFFQDQQARIARRQLAEQIASGKPKALPAPQPSPPKSEHLLADILEVCGDRQNQAAYFKLIQEHSEGLIWMALSETRQADREGRIRKSKGAYFTDTLKRLAPQR